MFPALRKIREYTKHSKRLTNGLSDRYIKRFEQHPALIACIGQASRRHKRFQATFSDLLKSDEEDAIRQSQKGFMNFYEDECCNPYIALAAQGPWIVTSHGAVLYDTGGYGMLGFGHNPPQITNALVTPQVQANIMTPNLSMVQFHDVFTSEVGHSRESGYPYESLVCLNSGSESVSLAMRIMDADALQMTASDGPHPGRESVLISLKGSFHGRTDRPAQASHATQNIYRENLASFQDYQLYTCTPNDVDELTHLFQTIDEQGLHVEGMLMEPVMGEGNPGLAIEREFYDRARDLCDEYRSLLLVDSIQAGFRATGCLSILDYPGFQDASPPDFETFSKSINGGQYPFSILALGPRVSKIYVKGLYGNTMTANPRALEIACSVITEFDDTLRENIQTMGKYMKDRLVDLMVKYPHIIKKVSGTGLLVAAHLDDAYPAYGTNSLESLCRQNGLGVIHGGANALRFTPHFYLNPGEVDIVIDVLEDVIHLFTSQN